MVGTDGALLDNYGYAPYGRPDDELGNPYRFTGQRFDEETGLYYYKARYYAPKVGRFLSPDPIGYADGLNLYAYVGNDPVNFIDPTGLLAERGLHTAGRAYDLVSGTVVGGVNALRTDVADGLDAALVYARENDRGIRLGGDAAGFLGVGVRYGGGLTLNPSTGVIAYDLHFGTGVGLGATIGAGASAPASAAPETRTFGSLDATVGGGVGAVGAQFTYNIAQVGNGQSLSGTGFSGTGNVGINAGPRVGAVGDVTLSIRRQGPLFALSPSAVSVINSLPDLIRPGGS